MHRKICTGALPSLHSSKTSHQCKFSVITALHFDMNIDYEAIT